MARLPCDRGLPFDHAVPEPGASADSLTPNACTNSIHGWALQLETRRQGASRLRVVHAALLAPHQRWSPEGIPISWLVGGGMPGGPVKGCRACILRPVKKVSSQRGVPQGFLP
jgi:hypothetical protein